MSQFPDPRGALWEKEEKGPAVRPHGGNHPLLCPETEAGKGELTVDQAAWEDFLEEEDQGLLYSGLCF